VPAPIMPPAEEWAALVPREDSLLYRRASDARVLLAAGYALLLQVSHPTVGAGVSEHSRFRSDPWGRLLRTLDYACTMVYAGPRPAGEMGRRMRDFHRQIRGVTPSGRRYHALEPEAYAWVHATLAAGIVGAHERFAQPFGADELEQLWAQWRTLGRLLGIRERDLPTDWQEFCAYFEDTVERRLERTEAVEEVLDALARPAPPALAALYKPLWALASWQLGHVIRLTSVGLLPPTLRARLGTPWRGREQVELAVIAAALRAASPLMGSSLRSTGPGYLRWRAQALARGDAGSSASLPSLR
jgi:uncharacterized protein (DUF2236 family)